MPDPELDGYLTLADAATRCGSSRGALNKAIAAGRLPSLRIGPGRRGVHLVRLEDVELYLASRPGGRERTYPETRPRRREGGAA